MIVDDDYLHKLRMEWNETADCTLWVSKILRGPETVSGPSSRLSFA
jgi:hypothetical protein